MLVRVIKTVALSVMPLLIAVFSLPATPLAATSPVVTVLSPIVQGLRAPVKMAMDSEGNSFVADQRVGGVIKFDAFGVSQLVIKTAAVPTAVAVAQDGTLLVSQESFVARYNVVTGQELGRLESGYLQNPSGIAVGDTGNIFVSDSGAKQVVVFSAEGSYLKSFGQGQLSAPSGIAFEKVSGQVAVADAKKYLIIFFDPNLGTIAKTLGKTVSSSTTAILNSTIGALQFEAPVAIAFEYSKDAIPVLNRMYVVDAFQHRLQAIDGPTVVYFRNIGSPGTTNGLLMAPSDVVFDSVNNRLLVVNGFGNVTIYGIDGGVNPVYVDKTPPVFTVNQVPAEVTADTVTITGTVEAGATVQFTSGALQAPATVQGTAWSAVVSGLVAGSNDIIITAKDSVGNEAAGQTVSVTYLLPAPVVTLSPTPSITKNSTIILSGTVDAGSTVNIVNQGISVVTGSAVVTDATWSYDVVLSEGINNLTVTAQKENSLKSTAYAKVVLDSAAPMLAVSALPSGSFTSLQVQNVTGTVSDAGVVTVTINGEPAALTNNVFSVPVALVTGTNEINVIAVDEAGNASADNRVFYFDATAPVITILDLVDNSFTATPLVQINGTVNKVSVVNVAGSAAAVLEDNSWNAVVSLVDGVNTIDIVATDLYGNTSSVKRTLTLDIGKPELSISSPEQDVAIKVPSLLITGKVSDSSTLSVECSVNTAIISVPVTDGQFSFTVDFAAEGIYPVTVTARDAAGNTSTVVRNVIYDITPPLLTMVQSTVAMPASISGTVESGAAVVVTDVSAVALGTVVVSGGNWTADLTGVTYNPETLVAIATDVAGNKTEVKFTYTVITVTDGEKSKSPVESNASATGRENANVDIIEKTMTLELTKANGQNKDNKDKTQRITGNPNQ